MDKQVAKLMKELRKDPMYELYDDEKLAAFAEEIKQEISDYEASARPAGTHWPENLVASILGLKWVELKESVDGESVEEVLSGLFDTLTPRESKVIQMFYKEEKSLFEIADEFNVSYATIRSVLAQGTGKLCHPSRSKHLAECIEKSDKEPVIRTRERTLARWLDDEESAGEENNGNAEDDDFFKDIFDDPDDKGDTED